MKRNLKLTKNQEETAIKHITDYYSYNVKCNYSKLIDSILKKFEKNILDFNQLKTDNELENFIIKKMLSVFIALLNNERQHNKTGLFGAKEAFFSDGTNYYYKDLIKNEFVKAHPIYAHDLKELKLKIRMDNGVWLIFDNKKFGKIQRKRKKEPIRKSRVKRKKAKPAPPKTIDEIIEENRQKEGFSEMQEKEKEKFKKGRCLDKRLKLDKEKDTYKKDIHKFFR